MAGFVFWETEAEIAARRACAARIHAEIAAVRMRLSVAQLCLLLKNNFNPNQPRVPTGQAGGGRWAREGGFSDGLVRVAANGKGPLVPGGTYSVPVSRNPLDPARLNPQSLPLEEQQQVADAVNALNEGNLKTLQAMQGHRYRNIPDPKTEAALPQSSAGYQTYYVGSKTGKKRLLVDNATGQMYYTNNHHLSFWLIVPLPN